MSNFGSNGPRLLAGERVLWSGDAGRGLLFQSMDIFLIPFSIIWLGFVLSMFVETRGTEGPAAFGAFEGVFLAVGVYFVAGRFLVDMLMRRATSYAVSDRRLLIDRRGLFPRQTSISLRDLPPMSLREGGSGRGSIRFGEAASMWRNNGMGFWSPSLDPTPQFLLIDNVRHVFDLIARQQDELGRRP